MVLGINNFFDVKNKNAKVADFQDLDHLDDLNLENQLLLRFYF